MSCTQSARILAICPRLLQRLEQAVPSPGFMSCLLEAAFEILHLSVYTRKPCHAIRTYFSASRHPRGLFGGLLHVVEEAFLLNAIYKFPCVLFGALHDSCKEFSLVKQTNQAVGEYGEYCYWVMLLARLFWILLTFSKSILVTRPANTSIDAKESPQLQYES
ncbi:unnamed protein product [Periconia digitata]|uniref:Uncharacterized protein n=1 Tax=Periconia digitata TaxID=1303443 RepID=A0A9W4UKH5_9PLEO|nr:unnamed protein product [Periconia digitata]